MRGIVRQSKARKGMLRYLCVLVGTLMAMQAHAATVSEISVHGLSSIDEAKVRKVIGIQPGDTFSLNALDTSVAYLRTWGVFDTINASPSMTPEGVAIDYHVEEATVVAVIDISGNYPYLEAKIRKYLTLHPGDIYTPDRLQEQIDRIKEYYQRQGYVGTEVYVDEELEPEVNGVALTFHIRRGDLLRYRSIEVMGNKAFPDGRFVSAINTWLPFSERRLRQSIRELKEFYREQGYPKVRISITKKHLDFDALRVDLVLEVREGPHVVIAFEGSPHTSRRLLRKTVPILEYGSIDHFEIESSAEAIQKLLVSRGYPQAKVTWKKETLPDESILITFILEEGPSRRIKHLRVVSEADLSKKELAAEMLNQQMSFEDRGAYFPDLESEDNATLQRALRSKGYLDATIDDWEVTPTKQGYAVNVTIPIDAGNQTIVNAIIFEGNHALDDKLLLKALINQPERPIDEPALEQEAVRLKDLYANSGYPYAEVAQSLELDAAQSQATIRFQIDEGPLVRIGSILIVGDVLTSQKAIKRAMEIQEGDPFSLRKIIESRLNIRRLGPFSYVSIETLGIKEKHDIVHLRVKIEEQRPFLIDLALNYSTDESITGSLAFSNINAFGWAKTNSLRLTAGRNLSRAEIVWLDPRFLGSSFEMSSAGWIQYKQKPAYAFMQIAGGVGWTKRFSRFGLIFWYELDRNYFVEGDSTAADADSLRDNTISNIALTASYDSRDNFSYPTKGIYTIGRTDIFNEIGGNNANFVKLSWKGEFDFSLLSKFVLSSMLRVDRILTVGTNVSVPTNELLFLGGDDTIRGFAQDSLGPTDSNGDPTGSRSRWIFNEELRFLFFDGFSLAGFFDTGSLTNNFSDVGLSDIRSSAGVGLRYNTPVGPIRLDYGFKLDREPGESIGRLHITFGYLF